MRRLVAIAGLLLLAGCASWGDPYRAQLSEVSYDDLPGWSQDHHAEPYRMFVESCRVKAKRANFYTTRTGEPVGVPDGWRKSCAAAARLENPTDEEARGFFEANFTPYRVKMPANSLGRLTGYYEPLLHGSLRREGRYQTPVYGIPRGGAPYPSRAEIEAGALKGRAPVLLYVEDPVMLFFLHIQGSGKVRLPDGRIIGLQYAGQNGHNYWAIGRTLKDEGRLEQVTLQTIRAWLYANPEEAQRIMNTNPSYIFFKLSPGTEMARGALGIPLTPGRSLAVDDERAAYGVPTYIATRTQERGHFWSRPFRRLMVSQDTGGAIIGANRGDIFFGRGEDEEWQAGHQNSHGKVFWLLPHTQKVGLEFLEQHL